MVSNGTFSLIIIIKNHVSVGMFSCAIMCSNGMFSVMMSLNGSFSLKIFFLLVRSVVRSFVRIICSV